VREIVSQTRRQHPGSRHVVHAFVVGGQGEVRGSSDDGEPSGTAGRPALELIRGRDLTQVIITVVRYFGGIKLGTGGLVRAYSAAARGVLDLAATEDFIPFRDFTLRLPYALYRGFLRNLAALGGQVLSETFDQEVALSGRLPSNRIPGLEQALANLTSGRIEARWL
jgi:uncharacterized YigZ family protein